MPGPAPDVKSFFAWFQSHDGYIDTTAIDIAEFPASEGGRGAIALKDIPGDHTLFSIPRSLLLGKRTSALPAKFGLDAWKAARLDEGWSGLIICLMWEASLGEKSEWAPYFDIMPSRFDTPMFWNEDDLSELKGTAVVDKLGRDQAESDYKEKVTPALLSRPDLFLVQDLPTRYSLEMYHIMGTRLLTRSFTLGIELVEGDDSDDERPEVARAGSSMQQSESLEAPEVGDASLGSAMDLDDPDPDQHTQDKDAQDDDEDEGEGENEVVLVPLADMLNARYKENNAKLFYEKDCLRMVSTKPIRAGEQIWNTYGDLPNSELLRTFGHVDLIPLPSHIYGGADGTLLGNPGDIVHVRADLVVESALAARKDIEGGAEEVDTHERIDWWLEEGGEDVFILEIDPSTPSLDALDLPQAFISFIRLILYDAEWERTKSKGKPPRPKVDVVVLGVVVEVLGRRREGYGTSLEDDEITLSSRSTQLSANKLNALIVRLGEKRLLNAFLKRSNALLAEAKGHAQEETLATSKKQKLKRKAGEEEDGRRRKKR